MASLLASSHITLLSRKPSRNARLLLPSKSLSFAKTFNAIPSSFSVASNSGGGVGGVSDEWGEKSNWDPPGRPSSDPPKDDDEWGPDRDPGKKTVRFLNTKSVNGVLIDTLLHTLPITEFAN
jgi:hypothetical protein